MDADDGLSDSSDTSETHSEQSTDNDDEDDDSHHGDASYDNEDDGRHDHGGSMRRWHEIANGGPVRRPRANRTGRDRRRSPTQQRAVFIQSRRRKNLLSFGSNVYRCNRRHNDRTYWTCVKCSSTAITENGFIVRAEKNHTSHLSNPAPIEARVVRSAMRNRAAASTDEPARQIVDQIVNEQSEVVRSYLPSNATMQASVRREQRQVQGLFACPRRLKDLIGWPERVQFIDGELFMHFDNSILDRHDHVSRVVIFTTTDNLDRLRKSDEWFADATYKIVPKPFRQMWTIFATVGNRHILPLVFVLMVRETTDAYEEALHAVKNLIVEQWPGVLVEPAVFHLDFDTACINAVKNVFRRVDGDGDIGDEDVVYVVRIGGCFFHLTQALIRRLAKLGLASSYRKSEAIRLVLQMLGALAMLQPDEVSTASEAVRIFVSRQDFGDDADKVDQFLSYWTKTWIGTGTRAAILSPDYWCIGDLMAAGFARTNSPLEGFHSDIHCQMGTKKLTAFKMVLKLQKVQIHTRNILRDIDRGRPPTPRNHAKWATVWRCTRAVMQENAEFDFNTSSVDEQIRYIKSLAAATTSVYD